MSIVNIREEYETEEEATQRKQAICLAYPPGGYDTSLRVYQQPADHKWIVDGYRYSSCD
jgi:hypothetical protein